MYASWLRQPRGHVSSVRQWPGAVPLLSSASFVPQLFIAASSGPPCVCFGPISAALDVWMPCVCCRFGDLALRAVVSAVRLLPLWGPSIAGGCFRFGIHLFV